MMLNPSKYDRMREAVVLAHADVVAVSKLFRRFRWVSAYRALRRSQQRLAGALTGAA